MKSVCLVILLFKVLTIFGSARTPDHHVNECEAGTHNCSEHAICNDIKEGFQCSCMTGYPGDGYKCTDVNECTTDNKCDKNADCLNTLGSYQCSCMTGYMGDGYNCTDVDECTTDNKCHYRADCVNTLGSYKCSCVTGFTRDGYNRTDVNECAGNNKCHKYADCLNTLGSYQCSCKPGFTGNGMNCDDIDECATLPHNCDYCYNSHPGFRCRCPEGFFENIGIYPLILDTDVYYFQIYGDSYDCSNLPYNCTRENAACKCFIHVSNIKTICFEIDECISGQNHCHENATCIPVQNSTYTCQCNHGFIGNGFNCTDVDECESFQPPCTNCTNTIGGYSCGCLNGYDGDQCTDIDECAEGTHNCHPRATCTNTDGSYNCTCDDGYYVAGDNGSWCSGCINDSWTAWMNFDFGYDQWYDDKYSENSFGIGDFEILSVARKSFPYLKICQNPTNIDMRSENAGPYYRGGDKVHISVDGFYCLNDEQDDGRCNNYNVRFCCPELHQTTPCDSPEKRLSKLIDSSGINFASSYYCSTLDVALHWTKTNIGLGYAYKLQVQDGKFGQLKETSVQILLTKESYIESISSSPKDCTVTTKFLVSTTKDVIVEVIVGRFENQIKTISKVIHQGGKQNFEMTFVDYIQMI